MTKIQLLAIGQIALVMGQIALYYKITELQHNSHKHTFWFKNGKKVDETISFYEYQETK